MRKGKQGQARKKAPPPEDKDDKEEVQDGEMQLQFSAKNDKTTTSTANTSSTSTPSVPWTAKITKECVGSITISLTSNKTESSNSRVGSAVHGRNATTTKLLSENVLSKKF